MKYFLHFMREGGRAEEFPDLSTIEFACEGPEWESGDYKVVDENGVEYVPDFRGESGTYKLVPKGSR